MILNDSKKIWNPFRKQPHYLENYKLSYTAEHFRESYTEETGKSAYYPCRIKVKIESICERLLANAGYSLEFCDEIVIPKGHKYSAYCEDSYKRGFTDFTNKRVCIQSQKLTERFTLAHETCHALHDANFPETLTEGDSPAWLEAQYNKFARYLGLPDDVYPSRFIHWCARQDGDAPRDDQLKKILSCLAGEFEMPGFSVLLRGRDLGFISQETVDRFIRDKIHILPPNI